MKDPAFLWYPNDYMGGTYGWNFTLKGAYVDLLMLQFNRGHMTYDMIAQVLGQEYAHLWVELKSKFKVDPEGLYFNQRLDDEVFKRKSYCTSRRNNVSGKNQFTKEEFLGAVEAGHMTSHMENENVNRNIIEFKDKEGVGEKGKPTPRIKSKDERESDFRDATLKFIGKYPEKMLNDFILFWTESNPNGKKLKFEMRDTFDIGRRLVTWSGKEFNQIPEKKPAAKIAGVFTSHETYRGL